MSNGQRAWGWFIGFVVIACVGCKPDKPDVRPARATGAGIHGSLYVEVAAQQILLPDVEVYAHSTTTATDSAPVTTDLYGRYAIPRQPPGVYVVRWRAQRGWAQGQHPDTFVIASATQYPLPAAITPEKTGGVIFGTVTLADGGSAWFRDELFAANRTAMVTVLDAARRATLGGPVRANTGGGYAVAGLPRNAGATVRATAEAATVTRAVAASAVFFGGAAVPTNVALPNRRPEIVTVFAQSGTQTVKTAAPGTTVRLQAVTRDGDGDPLTYVWKTVAGSGSLAPAGGPAADWTLPAERGVYNAYLEVKDGRGGFAIHHVVFETGKTEETFSGRAVDRTGTGVAGATVTVNGVPATTASNGFFQVSAPLDRRYVVNIRKEGFALFSRVVDAGETGQTWRLVRAQAQVVDPTRPIVLVDNRPELEKRRAKGVTVRVPAGALVDPAGNRATGPLTAYLATFDIAGGEAPGDWGAMQGGKETNLISYGAGDVEFVDAAGTFYNLAPGTQAEIEVVPPATMMAAAPAGAPMWSYDQTDGYWKESGTGTFDAATGRFIGKVKHFSPFNADLTFGDSACMKVLLYPPLPVNSRLRLTDPSSAHFTQTIEFVLNRPLYPIFRLLPGIDVQLQLLDPSGNSYGNLVVEEVPGTPLPGAIVNTGVAVIPAGTPAWLDEPFTPCKLVTLRLDVATQPSVFLSFKQEGSDPKAEKYYAAVDPAHLRDTLGEWWTTNGFTLGADGWPDNAIRTSYLNDNDLGSGRDMYFRDLGGGRIAAFVTNYGAFDQDPANADLADARATPGATVCMEYSPIEDDGDPTTSAPPITPIVKFFVYAGNGGQANAALARSANLDNFGEKFVPNLCLNCHGGNYYIDETATPAFADVNMGARFRELDTATYKFPGGAVVPSAAAKALFKQQNLMIRNAGNGASASAIRALIDGWYISGTTDQDNTWEPSDWTGAPKEALYHDVVKASCRTCHVAFDDDATRNGNSWTTYEQLTFRRSFLENYVLCGGTARSDYRYMPHAVVTYRNFWLSGTPHRPGVLRSYADGATWPTFGECSPP